MNFVMGRLHVTVFAAAIVFASSTGGYAQVPKAEDIAACNAEAQRAIDAAKVSGASTQPNAKDQSRAAEARRTETPAESLGGGVKSNDPQLAGMNLDGAKHPAYQAAYRTCMRKAGF
jgi:hypothetical protein